MSAVRTIVAFCALLLAAIPTPARASGGADIRMEPSPINRLSLESQQRGARTFVNYCLNCHSAKYMRYQRLTGLGIEASMVEEELIVPYAKQALIGNVYESARVIAEDYDERGTRLRVKGLGPAIERLRRSFVE